MNPVVAELIAAAEAAKQRVALELWAFLEGACMLDADNDYAPRRETLDEAGEEHAAYLEALIARIDAAIAGARGAA